MNARNRSLSAALIFCSALALPGMNLGATTAQDNRQADSNRDAKQTTRVYDRAHKDYHDWNDNEDRSYRQYLGEKKQDYRDYSKMSRRQQTQYWNWRHTHEAEEHGTMR